MKKETRTFPLNNLVSIEINRENGVAIGIYEEKKPAYKVGGWYYLEKTGAYALAIDNELHCVGVFNGEWFGLDESYLGADSGWQPADMQEVKKLLIGEAEKRGFKKGDYIKSTQGNIKMANSGVYLDDGSIYMDYNERSFITIFNGDTGKWAEIIEEKKPLYTNAYGLSFLRGISSLGYGLIE